MSNKVYNKTNFHQHTFCVFQEVTPDCIQNLKLNFKSKSGSSYYFTTDGVFRMSNHWGRAANCKWRLESIKNDETLRNRIGFAKWESFHEDNNFDKLYFIFVDFEPKVVSYFHKNHSNYCSNNLLRTASDNTKRIKIIRNLLNNDSWTKYYDQTNITILKELVIQKLVTTNLSLQEIKAQILKSS